MKLPRLTCRNASVANFEVPIRPIGAPALGQQEQHGTGQKDAGESCDAGGEQGHCKPDKRGGVARWVQGAGQADGERSAGDLGGRGSGDMKDAAAATLQERRDPRVQPTGIGGTETDEDVYQITPIDFH